MELKSLSRRRFSPLTRRILFVNMLPLLLLAVGVLYLDDFRRGLIEGELQALTTQSQIIAAALGEAAVSVADPDDDERDDRLAPELARQILRRLVEPTRVRARLFDDTGALLADSRMLGQGFLAVEVAPLPPHDAPSERPRAGDMLVDLLGGAMTQDLALPPYRELRETNAADYEEARLAFLGEGARAVRRAAGGGLVLTAAEPVQRFKQVLGALMLSTDGQNIENALRTVRRDILRLAAATLALTVLLSLYLAGTIARPVRRLARAADRVTVARTRSGVGGTLGAGAALSRAIPDLTARGDEIGDLSAALRDMTEARVSDPGVQQKLMGIVLEDVARLDRLITDIAGASRLDAELSRTQAEPVDLAQLLQGLAEALAAVAKPGQAKPVFGAANAGPFAVMGIADRLGQVFRNVVANAQSFSPPDASVRIALARVGNKIAVTVDDNGPGIPAEKFDAIFERFYSERPASEKFGTHSGLGLSISRQIVEAHGGTITAENRQNEAGGIDGARFTIQLPAA
jgi:two-component system sensor histidine kinase ChvG